MDVKSKSPTKSPVHHPPSPTPGRQADKAVGKTSRQSSPKARQDPVTMEDRVKREPWDPETYVAMYNAKSNAVGLPTFRGDAKRLEYIGASLYTRGRSKTIAQFVDVMRDYDLMDI